MYVHDGVHWVRLHNSVKLWKIWTPQNVVIIVKVEQCGLIHQTFVITAPMVLGNSGNIDFSLWKAQLYSQHCREIFMVKALPKALLLPQQVNVKLPPAGLRMESKSPMVPWHWRDDAEVKTWHLSPAMSPLSQLHGSQAYIWLVQYHIVMYPKIQTEWQTV